MGKKGTGGWHGHPEFDDPDDIQAGWWDNAPSGYGLGIQYELPDGTWTQVIVGGPDEAAALLDELDASNAEVWGWVEYGDRGWDIGADLLGELTDPDDDVADFDYLDDDDGDDDV